MQNKEIFYEAGLFKWQTREEMLDKGYVYQKEVPIAFNRKIKIVCANWEQLIKDGLWNPDA